MPLQHLRLTTSLSTRSEEEVHSWLMEGPDFQFQSPKSKWHDEEIGALVGLLLSCLSISILRLQCILGQWPFQGTKVFS